MELEGKVAIVTGASRGIGKAIALELGKAGAKVVVNYFGSQQAAEEVVAQITNAIAVKADISTQVGCDALIRATEEAFGPPDILVNNAGVTADNLVVTMTDEQWEKVISTNLGGTFRMSRAVMFQMARRRGGSIINLASISGLRGRSGQANYSASKGGIIAMSRSMALEVAKRKVRINVVAPGFIETDMTSSLNSAVIDGALKMIPMRRFGKPEDIAKTVRFLAGPWSEYITGQVLVVDGGMST